MLNKLRCHSNFQFSANQITWSWLLLQVHILNGKQCRSRSSGFFRSQLIWIYIVCKGRIHPGSAGQGLRVKIKCNLDYRLRQWRTISACAFLLIIRYQENIPRHHKSYNETVWMLTAIFDLHCTATSGGTSVGNHNRSSVGIGCCCRCDFPIIIGSWIIGFGVHVSLLILVHGHVFTSSFNCIAQQLNSIFTKRLSVLFFRDLVAYVKHVIDNLNCFFFFFLQIQIIIPTVTSL